MKIIKYSKTKNGMYKLEIEENDKRKIVELHEDLILKSNLLIDKILTEEKLFQLEQENLKYESYNMAVKYLKNRMRCTKEICDYLKKNGYSNSNINEVIGILKKQGYINDEQYIKSYINDKIILTNDGPIKIQKELELKKFDLKNIKDELINYTEEIEKEKIKKISNKLLKTNKNSEYNFKMKCKNHLVNLGYHTDLINDNLKNLKIDDSNILKKEYEKLYKKYSKKYSGSELEYKIKQSLYQKGYRNFDI